MDWSWSGFYSGSGTDTRPYLGNEWRSPSIGNVEYNYKPNNGGTIMLTATAYDQQGESRSLTAGPIIVTPCRYQNQPPTVTGVGADPRAVNASNCQAPYTTRLSISVSDPETGPGFLGVTIATSLVPLIPAQGPVLAGPGGSAQFSNGLFVFDWGPRPHILGGPYRSAVRVTVTVTDDLGGSSSATFDRVFEFVDCQNG